MPSSRPDITRFVSTVHGRGRWLGEFGRWASSVASCVHPVSDGLDVTTESEAITRHRRNVLQLMLEQMPVGPPDDTEFGRWTRHYDVDVSTVDPAPPRFDIDADSNPFIRVDMNQCILCTRCVRACDEIQGRDVWGVTDKGFGARIVAGVDTTMLEARCESCGLCAAVCPTDALVDRQAFEVAPPEKLVRTTCAYCGVG